LKVSGYKVSALEIEATLLAHPGVSEVAVVGADDEVMGQRVVAVVSYTTPIAVGSGADTDTNADINSSCGSGSARPDLAELRAWCKARIAHYKAPHELVVVRNIPRNAMGKVNKKQLLSIIRAQ
jgi:malonyl-CoA/methylmalonyl-CoA synthetase